MKKIIAFMFLCTFVNANEYVYENKMLTNITSFFAEKDIYNIEYFIRDSLDIFNKEINSLTIEQLHSMDVKYVYSELMKDKSIKGVIHSDLFLRCYISSVENLILKTEKYSDLKLNFSDKLNRVNFYPEVLEILIKNHANNVETEKELFNKVFSSWGFESYREFINIKGYSSILLDVSEAEGRTNCIVALMVSKTERHKRINFRLLEEFIIKGGNVKSISMNNDLYLEKIVTRDFIKQLKFQPIQPTHVGIIDIFIYSDLFRKKIKNPLFYNLW